MPEENVGVENAEVENPATETGTENVESETGTPETTEVTEEQKAAETGETLDLTETQYELIRDLLDPKTQRSAIEKLAREHNIGGGDYSPRATRVNQKDETPQGPRKTLLEEIKELMGEDFENVPKTTWRAIERLFDAKIQPIREQFQQIEANRINADSKAATVALYGKFNDAEKYARDMVGLMENYVPAQGQTQLEFLEDMYHLAKSRRTSSKNSGAGKFVARVRSNAKEERIASQGSDERNIAPGSSKKISLDEAARLAMAGKKVTR